MRFSLRVVMVVLISFGMLYGVSWGFAARGVLEKSDTPLFVGGDLVGQWLVAFSEGDFAGCNQLVGLGDKVSLDDGAFLEVLGGLSRMVRGVYRRDGEWYIRVDKLSRGVVLDYGGDKGVLVDGYVGGDILDEDVEGYVGEVRSGLYGRIFRVIPVIGKEEIRVRLFERGGVVLGVGLFYEDILDVTGVGGYVRDVDAMMSGALDSLVEER